jgi:purine-cytosine permease-like protein
MGKRTGVSQLALGRMAVGRRGSNVPSITQGVITLAWMGLNTYVVLDLATYHLHKLGLPNSHATEYGVAAVIMIIQLIIGGEAPTTRIRAIASRQHSGQRSTRVRSARSRSHRATDRQP